MKVMECERERGERDYWEEINGRFGKVEERGVIWNHFIIRSQM
jgi:hypothetical protein